MAMYLFASRLTSAVYAFKQSKKHSKCCKLNSKTELETSNMSPTTTACSDSTPNNRLPSSLSEELRAFSALVEEVRVEKNACASDCDNVEQFQRNQVTRKSLGACDRSHRCDNRPTKHRVHFSNTFPRINRRKKISEHHEEGEIVLQNEEEMENHEVSKNDKDLVYRNNNLVSGSLDALSVRLLTPPDNADRAFTFAFVLSSRLFINPSQLLGQLIFLTNSSSNLKGSSSLNQSRLVHLLAEWMEMFPYDFKEEKMMSHVKGIIQRYIGVETLSSVLQNLLQRLTSLERHHQFLDGLQEIKVEDKRDLLASASSDLAHQLTIIELQRISNIGAEEFLQVFSNDSSKQSPNKSLDACIAWSNRLTYLVATQIVQQSKKNRRMKMIEFWIETGHSCLKMNNFNSLASIVSGLNLPSVSRLRSTWMKVDRRKLVTMEKLLDTSGDFSTYREALQSVSRSLSSPSKDETATTIVPYFSVFLQDVFSLQQACCQRLHNGHINFEKFWQMAKLVTEFITWQQGANQLVKDEKLSLYLQCYQTLSESELLRASFQCEAPSSLVEREKYKSIKST